MEHLALWNTYDTRSRNHFAVTDAGFFRSMARLILSHQRHSGVQTEHWGSGFPHTALFESYINKELSVASSLAKLTKWEYRKICSWQNLELHLKALLCFYNLRTGHTSCAHLNKANPLSTFKHNSKLLWSNEVHNQNLDWNVSNRKPLKQTELATVSILVQITSSHKRL